MPIVPGKPGSVRVRGQIRAQLRQLKARCARAVLYNAILGAKTPPVVFMSEEQTDAMIAAQQAATQLLNQLNS